MKRTESKIWEDKLSLPLRLPADYSWKVLGALHTDLCQYLTEDENALLTQIIRARDLSAYLILSSDWGLQSIALKDWPLPSVRAKYQLASLLKKFQFPDSGDNQRNAAIKSLYASEERCKAFNESGFNRLLKPGDCDWSVSLLQNIKSFVVAILGEEPHFRKLTPWQRHGPGANLDTCEGQKSMYDKYDNWPYSCTIGAYRYARFMIETDQRWFGALQQSYREQMGIPMHYPLDMKAFWATVIRIVDYNRISTVPKDSQTDRLIAIEPALNIILQLGVGGFIQRQLLRFGVNLNCQRKNQRLARLGSITGAYSTIDLSAASESISLKLCELVLPKAWYALLLELRAPRGYLTDSNSFITYEKISSMGNGFTFALESLLFAAITYAAIKAEGGALHFDELAIYGDDIIVPTQHFARVTEALIRCGFTLNRNKTFHNGPVRESCGTDWFDGYPIRPVFLSSDPSDVMGLFNDYNRLKRYLLCNFGVESEKSVCCQRIYRWIPIFCRNIIGPYSDDEFDSYLHFDAPYIGTSYKYHVHSYTRLYKKALRKRGPDFHMRKLMHNLRGQEERELFTFVLKKESSSRFRVNSQEFALSVTSSVASSWRDWYDELAYIKLR